MVNSFEKMINNPFIRSILKSSTQYCEADKGNRLEVALELYTGKRKHACVKCRFT